MEIKRPYLTGISVDVPSMCVHGYFIKSRREILHRVPGPNAHLLAKNEYSVTLHGGSMDSRRWIVSVPTVLNFPHWRQTPVLSRMSPMVYNHI